MSLIQSAWADGRSTPPRPQTAGAVHVAKFRFPVTRDIGAGDVLEIGILPAFAHIVDAALVAEGAFAAVTADVGLMSGAAGELNAARTVGTQLFAAGALTGVVRLNRPEALALPATGVDRGIGVKFSGAVTGGAGKSVTLVLSFVQ